MNDVLEYSDGKWWGGSDESEPEAMVVPVGEPPTGWVWWANGAMGDAETQDEAKAAAESVLAKVRQMRSGQ